LDNLALRFGRVLRTLRTERELSQEELAFESGLNRQFVSLIELGQRAPSLASIYKLAEGLGLRGSELLAAFEQLSKARRAKD
jgi:transcriptional regulator with XRE-family HTH domain